MNLGIHCTNRFVTESSMLVLKGTTFSFSILYILDLASFVSANVTIICSGKVGAVKDAVKGHGEFCNSKASLSVRFARFRESR